MTTFFQKLDEVCQSTYEAVVQDGLEPTRENMISYLPEQYAAYAGDWLEHRQDEILEDWQVEAIKNLMSAPNVTPMDDGRFFITSQHDDQKYHVITKVRGSLQIEQTETSEKWNKRLVFERDQVNALARACLQIYLDNYKPKPPTNAEDDQFINETLTELDDHPF